MRIAILSRERKNYSTTRLVEAAEKRGHKVKVMDTLGFTIQVEEQEPDLFYRNKPVPDFDAVIPRIGSSVTFYGCAVVRQFEQMGVLVLNNSHSISVSRDKLRSLQVLSRHEIGLPDSAFARNKKDILPAIDRVGGAPVIIKLLEGTQGVGVILAESTKMAEAIIQTLQSVKQSVLIQKFVAESRGKDVRAFVVGNNVVAAMRRQAQGDEFRSNVHRGGSVQPVELSEEYQRTAVHAAHILGLRVAGVDMLETKEGPKVLEVNSSPGLEGIERASGVNIADVIIDSLEEQLKFPDIDLRNRLTLNSGYSVSEFQLDSNSELVGKTLSELDLRENDVLVLSIDRQSVTIPSPRGDTELLLGDKILCYGKSITLKSLIPVPAPRSRTKKKKKPLEPAADEAADTQST